MSIEVDLKEASSGDRKFVPQKVEGSKGKDLSNTVVAGINKGIEDLLVVANARER